ncbi:MAG: alpha/beta hydrolase-fold protein [Aquihabitans sp.]
MHGSLALNSIGRLSVVSWGFRLTLLVACIAGAAAGLHWRHQRWHLVGAALLTVMLLGANVADSVNAHYSYLPNVASVFTGYRAADQNSWTTAISARHRHEHSVAYPAAAPPVMAAPPAITESAPPARGTVVEVSIPGIASGFMGRPAEVYLPPAWISRPSVRLPVLVMLHGTPGSPLDWTRSAGVDVISDRWAGQHGGVAPILVMPDVNGRFFGDSECTDGPKGNVDTYLSVDVPGWIRSHLHPAVGPQGWAVGGLSEGGLCAIDQTLRHPQVYATFLDFSGDAHPSHRGGMETLFDGSVRTREALVRTYDPMHLLAGFDHPTQITGWFEVGTGDRFLLAAARDMHGLAHQRGMDTRLVVVPRGHHDFRMWKRSFHDAYLWVAPRLTDASDIPGEPRRA